MARSRSTRFPHGRSIYAVRKVKSGQCETRNHYQKVWMARGMGGLLDRMARAADIQKLPAATAAPSRLLMPRCCHPHITPHPRPCHATAVKTPLHILCSPPGTGANTGAPQKYTSHASRRSKPLKNSSGHAHPARPRRSIGHAAECELDTPSRATHTSGISSQALIDHP